MFTFYGISIGLFPGIHLNKFHVAKDFTHSSNLKYKQVVKLLFFWTLFNISVHLNGSTNKSYLIFTDMNTVRIVCYISAHIFRYSLFN